MGTRLAMSLPVQPHDRLFRAVFSEPEHAVGLLRAALPPGLTQQIDWTTLAPLRSSLVDSALQARYADVLFSVQLAGRPAILHLLVEHQSKPDRLMPLRLLGYMLRIWERLLRSKSARLPLPVIIPIVCHHSAKGWTVARALRELLALPRGELSELEPHVPSFEPIIVDLSEAADAALRTELLSALGRAALVCLTRVRGSKDVLGVLWRYRDAFAAVVEAPTGVGALALLVSYTLQATEAPPERLRPFFDQLGERAKEAFMTGAQMLIEQGRAEGLAKGLAKGRAEGEAKGKAEGEAKGKAEGKAELLLRLLRLKYGDLPEGQLARLRGATNDELERWAERVMTAATLDEVFEGR